MWLDDVQAVHQKLSPEQRLFFELGPDGYSGGVPVDVGADIDWPTVLALALQNRVEGILLAALTAEGLRGEVPPYVLSTLQRRAEISKARHGAVVDAFTELNTRVPALVRRLIIYRGLSFSTLYDDPMMRMVSDIDFVVLERDEGELRRALEAMGFELRPTFRGTTYVGAPRSRQIGCDYVTLDVHYEPLPRFQRSDLRSREEWLGRTRDFAVGEVHCQRFDPDLEVVTALVHLAEYASSWIHVCLEDDQRLIKYFDLELHCDAEPVDGLRAHRLACALGVEESFALGLAQFFAVRGALPRKLAACAPLLGALDECVQLLATPAGRIVALDVAPAERAFLTDRRARALQLVPESQRGRRAWHDPNGIPQTQQQPISSVLERVRIALSSGEVSRDASRDRP